MSQFEVCIQALKGMGCGVAFGQNTVKVRFPPDPDDPTAAPDGTEREYAKPFFTLLVSRVFMELMEQSIIDAEGWPLKGGENGS